MQIVAKKLEWKLPVEIAAGDQQAHHIHEHAGPRTLRVTRATIDTPSHIPPLVEDRSCDHDTAGIPPQPHCNACNFDEDTQTFRDAVDVIVRNESTEQILARTTIISRDHTYGETDMHVEAPAMVAQGDRIVAHFVPRGDGHPLPEGFQVFLYLIEEDAVPSA